MFKQAVQPTTIDRAPGTVQILASLRLLPRVVVIDELVKYSLFLFVFVIPNSFFRRRAVVVCGSYVLTGQRCTKRKWRRTPWRPRQWSARPRQFKLQGGAVRKHLERTHLWKESIWFENQAWKVNETKIAECSPLASVVECEGTRSVVCRSTAGIKFVFESFIGALVSFSHPQIKS